MSFYARIALFASADEVHELLRGDPQGLGPTLTTVALLLGTPLVQVPSKQTRRGK